MNRFRSSIYGGKGNDKVVPLLGAKEKRGAKGEELTSIAVERDEVRRVDHRDGDRHRLESETVAVRHDGAEHPATLINLSGGGAMIASNFMPRLWDRVDLFLGEGLPLECAVRWIRGDRLGLEFAHETGLDTDRATRDATLLDTIRRTFPKMEVVAAEPLPVETTATVAVDEGRRGDRRHPLIWSGHVHYNHDSHPVRLRNVSASGALVESQSCLPEGAEVLLDLGHGVEQFATVSWSRGEQNGLAFAAPFDLTRLAEARPQVTPNHWTRPGFLDLASQDSPWAAEWGRQSLDEMRDDLEGFLKR